MGGQDGGAGRIRSEALVLEHRGPRVRTVDEHMFSTPCGATMRVQMFTGVGLRPVAVVTQVAGEGGSLQNRAERYVEEIWRRLCPDELEPPLFIAHQLFGDEAGGSQRYLGFQQYRFAAAAAAGGRHTVERPVTWGPRLSPAELAELVDGPVDGDRGGGYVRREPIDEGRIRFATIAVVLLPRPDLHGEPSCMPTGTPWSRRLIRQVVPRQRSHGCCWYHHGDWRAASAAAIRALAGADTAVGGCPADVESDERVFAALRLVRDEGLDPWTRAAAESLLTEPVQLEREIGYVNGRHRSQAMLDAGVRRTLVTYWDWPADPTGGRR